jgi:cell wall-associated NlpC family hydrolase
MITEKEIRQEFLGIPFVHGGRTIEGLDCWGLPILIYRKINIILLDLENYEFNWGKSGKNYFLENYHKEWDEVKDLKFLDVILFRRKQNEESSEVVVDHAGIYLSKHRFIHCCTAGVVIGNLRDKVWDEKVEGYFRNKLLWQ